MITVIIISGVFCVVASYLVGIYIALFHMDSAINWFLKQRRIRQLKKWAKAHNGKVIECGIEDAARKWLKENYNN